MARSFTKSSLEQYPIAVDYAAALPSNAVLAAGSVSAVDLADGSDVTGTILDNPIPTVLGTQLMAFVQGGMDGHTYVIQFQAQFTPGSPVPVLIDEIIMVVYDAWHQG